MVDAGEMAAINVLSTDTSKVFIDAQLWADAATTWPKN